MFLAAEGRTWSEEAGANPPMDQLNKQLPLIRRTLLIHKHATEDSMAMVQARLPYDAPRELQIVNRSHFFYASSWQPRVHRDYASCGEHFFSV
jgi:hypothetical protein